MYIKCHSKNARFVVGTFAAMILGASSQLMAADKEKLDYPTDRVRIVVPFSPGGSTDSVARAFASELEEITDANVVVINQAAGGGTVATQNVQRAEPDGSQLLVSHSIVSVAHEMGRSPTSVEDLTTIATLNTRNNVYTARADAAYDNLEELIKYAETNDVTIGAQLGGTSHIMAQALSKASGGDIRVVDAGDGSRRLTSLLGGQIDLTLMSTTSAKEYETAGDAKVLGVISDRPDPAVPEWPTATSQGVEISYPNVTVVYGPGGMDTELASRINQIAGEVVASPGFAEKMENLDLTPYYLDVEGSNSFVNERWDFIKEVLSEN